MYLINSQKNACNLARIFTSYNINIVTIFTFIYNNFMLLVD